MQEILARQGQWLGAADVHAAEPVGHKTGKELPVIHTERDACGPRDRRWYALKSDSA